MTDKRCCENCYFYGFQKCLRHAPVVKNVIESDARWPAILEAWNTWCGDYEKKIDDRFIDDMADQALKNMEG